MVDITHEKIDVDTVLRSVEDDRTGGVVFFIGRVRNHSDGHEVIRMAYEGYDALAKTELGKIEAEVRAKWPVRQMTIIHRLGMLELGEASVLIAVACDHRVQAFEACQYTIDTLKKRIPVWKKEYGPDGESWVEGCLPEIT